jgi:hypothetical protein
MLKENAPEWTRKRAHTKTKLESQTAWPVRAQIPVSVNDTPSRLPQANWTHSPSALALEQLVLVAAPIVGPAIVAAADIGIAAGAVNPCGNNLQAIQSHNQCQVIESDNFVRRHEVDAAVQTERYKIDAGTQLLRERGFANGGKRTGLFKLTSRCSGESKKRDLWNGMELADPTQSPTWS